MSFFKLTKTVLSSMTRHAATVKYPFAPRTYFERTRGQIENEIEKCIFCGLCARKCPSQAITVNRADKSWSIDRLRCVQCNGCAEVCPRKCLHMKNTYPEASRAGSEPDVYRPPVPQPAAPSEAAPQTK